MRILLIAATLPEIEPTVTWLRARAERGEGNVLHFGEDEVEVMFTGVGLAATAFALGGRLAAGPLPDLCLQAGVGGAIRAEAEQLELGQVVRVVRERFADLGAETAGGDWLTLNDLGLAPGLPFAPDGSLRVLPGYDPLPLPEVEGVSVNRVTGSAESIRRLRANFPDARVESMEGAAFFYACLAHGLEPIQLRAISNFVEPRDRANWRLGEAIGRLNEVLMSLLRAFIG